jgi:enterochelin esterase family protein
VPVGAVISFTMRSADSNFYPGDAPNTGAYTRTVWVYVPRQYAAGTAAPFIVINDGSWYKGIVPRVLDNLIQARKLPALVAIMANSGGGDAQKSERGIEYDTVSGKFAEFVDAEMLPRVVMEVKTQLGIDLQLTRDREGRASMGGSSGGAAAFSMAWWHPELFRRVLTYSGTYVSQEWPLNPLYPHGAWSYHDFIIDRAERKPLRVWLAVGSNDLGSGGAETTYRNFTLANQRMAAVLKKKGYHYRFEYARGGSHTDARVTAQTLPSALLWLWRGYPID